MTHSSVINDYIRPHKTVRVKRLIWQGQFVCVSKTVFARSSLNVRHPPIFTLVLIIEPKRQNTYLWNVRSQKIQITLRIRVVWSENSLCAFWIGNYAESLHADNEDFEQTARIHSFGAYVRRYVFTLRFSPFGEILTHIFKFCCCNERNKMCSKTRNV